MEPFYLSFFGCFGESYNTVCLFFALEEHFRLYESINLNDATTLSIGICAG